MDVLFSELKAWGADTDSAVRLVLGDKGFYYEKLSEFGELRETELLKGAVEDKDYSRAFRLAHDLKGVTVTLGLMPLHYAAAAVTEDLREGHHEDLFRDMEILLGEEAAFLKILSRRAV
ncbi:MAG TPA: hypothetical protein DCL38_06770 [Lachnospiraceae bacterium]|nr:hypothetical protein [Lachnospiraceae bacterium]